MTDNCEDESETGFKLTNRRKFLAATGSGLVAGCLGGDDDTTPTEGESPTEGPVSTDEPTRTDGPTPTNEPPPTDEPTPPDPVSVPSSVAILVVSLSPHVRQPSVEPGKRMLNSLGERLREKVGIQSVTIDHIDTEGIGADTEPRTFPTDVATLETYDVIVFNSTNDANEGAAIRVLNDEQMDAFAEYVDSGGGFVGIHSPTDNQTEGSVFKDIVGANWVAHGDYQDGTIRVTDHDHPSTEHLPTEWEFSSQLYQYENVRDAVTVLLEVDVSTFDNAPAEDYPIAWYRTYGDGRSFYTGLGHHPTHYGDENFQQHVFAGLLWAADATEIEDAHEWADFQKAPVTTDVESPSLLDVAPDGRVFVVDRLDYNSDDVETVNVVDPETDASPSRALELRVHGKNNGLKGMALDPNFGETGWIYLFYAPPSETIDESHNRLSRFNVENGTIDPASETEILRVPIHREGPEGHYAGDINFGPDGELVLTVGDDTNFSIPFCPIDERDGQEIHDAQRTAANTADLRGSVLRILPREDGSYEIPDDNLFPESEYAEKIEAGVVRPEIYAMGCRNPYRATVDPGTGTIYWGDYGPGASVWDPDRGPPAIEEFNRAAEPGFYGWPYVRGPNVPYVDYDFATETSGDPFDPTNLINDSPNNDGLSELPSPTESLLYDPPLRGRGDLPDYAEPHVPQEERDLGLMGEPIAGPVYRWSPDHGPRALPPRYDGKWFYTTRQGATGQNWSGFIRAVTIGEEGAVQAIEPFMPDTKFVRPIDLTVGPKGALYLAEWGSDYEGPNSDAGVYRIESDPSTESERDAADVQTPFGLNLGGETTVTADGMEFAVLPHPAVTASGKIEFSGNEDPIDDTEHDELYQSLVFAAAFTYEINVPEGSYDVRLHFAENYFETEGERVQSASVNGETVVSDLDLYAEAGQDTAIIRSAEGVSASGGSLTVEITASVNKASLCAIEIRGSSDGG
jgi:glucose/arabinose dehydrogenase